MSTIQFIYDVMRVFKRYQVYVLFLFYGLGLFDVSAIEINIKKVDAISNYYIDSNHGDDTNEGRTKTSPWKSLTRIEQQEFLPGDTLFFKRGSSYSEQLTIKYSGEKNKPIVITEYGDKSQKAVSFTNSNFDPKNQKFGNCIRLKGNYIIVENLYFHDTVANLDEDSGSFLTIWELGAIYIDKNAKNCIVRNNEIYNCGVGIKSYGQYAKIEYNYIHDCNRVLKKWGWGPIAIWLGADYQEVSYNRIINYSAVNPNITWGPNSYGGGADGGAIEIDDARFDKSNISIHHNYTRDCQGFLEVTWTDVKQNPKYENFSIHHNVSDDYQQFIALWRGANCNIENNTIIRRKVNENEWGAFNITQANSKNKIRKNIIVTENNVVVFNVGRQKNAKPNSIIENNIYWASTDTLNIGFEGPGDSHIFSNPKFLRYKKGKNSNDFLLRKNSQAKGLGAL
jgi:hypothetical protein